MLGFQWILEEKLAGGSKPGLYDDWSDDLLFMQDNKINHILTLTETPLEYEDEGLNVRHFPINDMGVPTPRSLYNELVHIIDILDDEGTRMLVHCKAGIGRTGTVLACILTHYGRTPEEAITEIRTKKPEYIQNGLQENFVTHYYNYLNSQT